MSNRLDAWIATGAKDVLLDEFTEQELTVEFRALEPLPLHLVERSVRLAGEPEYGPVLDDAYTLELRRHFDTLELWRHFDTLELWRHFDSKEDADRWRAQLSRREELRTQIELHRNPEKFRHYYPQFSYFNLPSDTLL